MEKLQPPWFVDLLRSVLPEPNKDGEVQGETVDDGGLPQVKNVDDLLLCNLMQCLCKVMFLAQWKSFLKDDEKLFMVVNPLLTIKSMKIGDYNNMMTNCCSGS